MKSRIFAALLIFSLIGCAGVSIKPISLKMALEAHQDSSCNSPCINGYIVYEPIVVVEVSQKEVCLEKDSKGDCKKQVIRCSAGTPFVLPDYTKPYLVNIKSGIGKSGVDVTISDGWRLGNVKDNSDNTALLGTVGDMLGAFKTFSSLTKPAIDENCKAPGLYRVTVENGAVKLTPMLVYTN